MAPSGPHTSKVTVLLEGEGFSMPGSATKDLFSRRIVFLPPHRPFCVFLSFPRGRGREVAVIRSRIGLGRAACLLPELYSGKEPVFV